MLREEASLMTFFRDSAWSGPRDLTFRDPMLNPIIGGVSLSPWLLDFSCWDFFAAVGRRSLCLSRPVAGPLAVGLSCFGVSQVMVGQQQRGGSVWV